MSRETPLDALIDRLAGPDERASSASPVSASRPWSTGSCPDAFRATGDVSKIGKGRHTSSSVVLLRPAAAAARSSTPRASGRSAWPTSPPTTSSPAFDEIAEAAVDCPPRLRAHRRRPRVRARRVGGRRPAGPAASSSPRSGCCSAPSARSAPATELRRHARPPGPRGGTDRAGAANSSSAIGSSTASIRRSCPAPGVQPADLLGEHADAGADVEPHPVGVGVGRQHVLGVVPRTRGGRSRASAAAGSTRSAARTPAVVAHDGLPGRAAGVLDLGDGLDDQRRRDGSPGVAVDGRRRARPGRASPPSGSPGTSGRRRTPRSAARRPARRARQHRRLRRPGPGQARR